MSNDTFKWTDILLKKWGEYYVKDRNGNNWDIVLAKFKSLHTPIPEEKKEPSRVLLREFWFECESIMDGFEYCFEVSKSIPEEKREAVKSAILSVLNDDAPEEKVKEFKEGYWVHKEFLNKMSEVAGKKYTQQELDEAIEKAFNAAR